MRGGFAKDEDRLGFELIEVAEVVAGHSKRGVRKAESGKQKAEKKRNRGKY